MSKRKSASQPMVVKSVDMVFEDDDEIDDQPDSVTSASDKTSKDASASVSRVSGRAKKVKAIYDPSEFNGPVHKRKKEAFEAERQARSESKTPAVKPVKTSSPPTINTEKKGAITAKAVERSVPEVPVKPKTPNRPRVMVATRRSPEFLKRISDARKAAEKSAAPAPQSPQKNVVPVTVAKEPSKRIQARKLVKDEPNEISTAGGLAFSKFLKHRLHSGSGGSSDEYDKASTVEIKSSGIPDVRKWTHQQVFEYFSTKLGFNRKDASVFEDEEIDGEALLIMKRSDIVTTKFQKLKLGTALKMWSQILIFQTGSTDPTQAWK